MPLFKLPLPTKRLDHLANHVLVDRLIFASKRGSATDQRPVAGLRAEVLRRLEAKVQVVPTEDRHGIDTIPTKPPKAVKKHKNPFVGRPIEELRRLARSNDRDTSIQAAHAAHQGSPTVIKCSGLMMEDGVARIDEEICRDTKKRYGLPHTLSAFQHARLAWSEVGILVDTGRRRDTSNGSPSIEWIHHTFWKKETEVT